MIHIIIPVHNRLAATLRCIKSIQKQKIKKKLNIIIVDDGSSDGTSAYIAKNFSNIKILKGSGFMFWGGAVNFGIESVLKKKKPGDWVLLINNDVELKTETISSLISISENNKRKSVVIPLTLSIIDKKTVIKSGTIIKSWFLNISKHLFAGMKNNEIMDKKPIKVDIMTCRCALHPIEMFKIAGNYDAKNFNHYGCDDEFSIRIKKYGYSILLCPSVTIYLTDNKSSIKQKKINIKNFIHSFFSMKSSSNIIDKFYLTMKLVPLYAKLSFFLIGVLKSLYVFLKK